MSSAETVYQVDQKRRIITCVITFFVVIVLYIALAYLFQTRMPGVAAALGLTVYVYIAQFPVIKVYGDKLTSKIAVGKVVAMPFDGGHFSLQEVKGLKALMVSFSTDSYILSYHPANSRRVRIVGPTLKKAQLKAIFDAIPATVCTNGSI